MDLNKIINVLNEKKVGEDIFLHNTHEKVLKVLKQTDFLSPKYHVVVTNPPYMGGKGLEKEAKTTIYGGSAKGGLKASNPRKGTET